MNSFRQKYPFLCLSESDYTSLEPVEVEQDPKINREILNTNQTKVLYSCSQFPFEILEDSLFLGNVYHSNSQKYLKDLHIKAMIDFTLYEEEPENKIPSFKTEQYVFKNIPLDLKISVNLEFDEINKYIDSLIQEQKGPVLLYCTNGQSLSPAFAIAYLMYKKKMNVQLASMKVFAMMGKVDIAQWIYTQLLVYSPKV